MTALADIPEWTEPPPVHSDTWVNRVLLILLILNTLLVSFMIFNATSTARAASGTRTELRLLVEQLDEDVIKFKEETDRYIEDQVRTQLLICELRDSLDLPTSTNCIAG